MATKAEVLTRRQLNRATLARQWLLARQPATPLQAVEQTLALQAQLARPPFIALWSRVEGFRREDLVQLLSRREVVRGTAMRCTLHLVSARDYAWLRPAIQPVLTRAMQSVLRDRAAALDLDGITAAARAYLARGPRTFEEIRDHLEGLKLPGDERARGYAVRTNLPLVQVPADATWGYPGHAAFALADGYVGEMASPGKGDLVTFVRRYLAAFGPAAVTDAQVWSGFTSLREAFEALRPELMTFRDERKRELFDLPGAPRPAEDTPAPVRFLPEFDSLVLAHDDRSRLIADEHRPLIFRPNLRILPTFLVDGVVAGTWDVDRVKGIATLTMEAFGALSKEVKDALVEEGERLARFVEPEAKGHQARVSRRA